MACRGWTIRETAVLNGVWHEEGQGKANEREGGVCARAWREMRERIWRKRGAGDGWEREGESVGPGSHLRKDALGVLLVELDRGEGDLDEHLVVGAAGALACRPPRASADRPTGNGVVRYNSALSPA